jgi:hypothetical protein
MGVVSEHLVKRLLKLGPSRSLFHDLFDDVAGRRIEVKFGCVRTRASLLIADENLLECIVGAIDQDDALSFSEWKSASFDCNIQQVKRAEFEVLLYGLFFKDCIKVFSIESGAIHTAKEGGMIGYSDRQHKGNVGEGQFHISKQNLQLHLDHYLHRTLSYDDLLRLLSDPVEGQQVEFGFLADTRLPSALKTDPAHFLAA